jgi:lipopolysaccharide/colanic/teichoic acid biosynthesis glycosyltransferase
VPITRAREAPRAIPSRVAVVGLERSALLEGGLHPAPLIRPYPPRLRRALNVAAALVGLVVAAPLLVLIAIAIRLTSPGKIIYTQLRVGVDRRNPFLPEGDWRRDVNHGGRLFKLYKFRTMVTDSDAAGQVWATPDDPRVTRVGALLRKYRFDELPQLWNVLKGDMNVVGPRPEQPQIFCELRSKLNAYDLRQRVLPGVTGWAQINHHYGGTYEDVRIKLLYDLEYLERQSALEDIRIMLRTIPVVLLRKGAW